MTAVAAEVPSGADLRRDVARSRRSLQLRWGALITFLLLLLSVYSGGFFLYAAVAVGGLLALTTALTTIAVLELAVRRRLSSTEVEHGGVIDAWLELENHKDFPAFGLLWRDQIEPGLDVEGSTCRAGTLQGGEKARLAYRLHSTRRGLFRIGPAVVEAGGPFGLVRRFLVGSEVGFITVYPRSVDIGRGWPLGHRPIHEVPRRRSLFEDPSRFQGIREYRRGDSLRRVHWRATARSGKLQVKLFEPAVLEGLLLAVDMGAAAHAAAVSEGAGGERPPDAGELEELTVTAAASLAELVLAGGQSAGLVSNGTDAAERYPEDWSGGTFRRLEDVAEASGRRRKVTAYRPLEVAPAKGRWQRQRLRTALARLVLADGLPLPQLLGAELPRLPRSLVLMVVTPLLSPELTAAVASLRRCGIEVGVVWVGAAEPSRAAAMPGGVPVYAVRAASDLEILGAQQL